MVRNALIAVYILVVLAVSVVSRASVLPVIGAGFETTNGNLQAYNYQTYVGNLAVKGNSYVLVSQGEVLPLRSQMDMSAFVGSKVMISGIELEHQGAPKSGVEAVDPLPSFDSGSNVVFFVFGITTVTQ